MLDVMQRAHVAGVEGAVTEFDRLARHGVPGATQTVLVDQSAETDSEGTFLPGIEVERQWFGQESQSGVIVHAFDLFGKRVLEVVQAGAGAKMVAEPPRAG